MWMLLLKRNAIRSSFLFKHYSQLKYNSVLHHSSPYSREMASESISSSADVIPSQWVMNDVTTALAALVQTSDPKIDAVITSIRKKHDRAFPRWPSHCNFFFPCVQQAELDQFSARCATLLAALDGVEVEFDTISYFDHGKQLTWHL